MPGAARPGYRMAARCSAVSVYCSNETAWPSRNFQAWAKGTFSRFPVALARSRLTAADRV